ncbi:MAG: bifunctional demethylmenaquinone methyltransferase/2-methoxy-6-polyprenyl-1,4-benzoquinol methylase UbiE [Desulfobulbaceae bacterium]|jgi:demethylmenaquinone methyltransferase/2-methoxy-6-polyprenyl-1,4-benzoquinol methylase|nr:bifunctional demethylmenaquinone methyltransferase/2-methoxy-6-polyprenyl-1,4-benzoquinol methylase UbiE [Desulfobulbaceae bacterium]
MLTPAANQADAKGQRVRKMFDAIAPRYDLMNRVMTLGFDQSWRRRLVEQAGAGRGFLDLACGTGDIAAMLAGQNSQARVLAADFSHNMLMEARRRFADSPISWLACDANYLPFADASFDAVTFGYLLRNVADASRALAEVARVLKPGGRVVCLDTTPPRQGLIAALARIYLAVIVPFLGKLLAGDRSAYAYLTGSTMNFYPAEELAALFTAAGFVDVGFKRLMGGTVALHWGKKSA